MKNIHHKLRPRMDKLATRDSLWSPTKSAIWRSVPPRRWDAAQFLPMVSPALSGRSHTFEACTTWQSTKRRWLLTKRFMVRILFGEPNSSHFEILSAFWLTQQRYLRGKVGHIAGWQATLGYGDIGRRLAQIGSPPPLEGETLTVSVDQCTFG